MSDMGIESNSYAERRKLFKNIWDTAMGIDDNGLAKHKVIKTLRLEDVNSCFFGKKSFRKKERMKNLRTVCKKILDFCDHQEQEDFSKNDQSVPLGEGTEKARTEKTSKKYLKIKSKKKNIKKRKNVTTNKDSTDTKGTNSEGGDNVPDSTTGAYKVTDISELGATVDISQKTEQIGSHTTSKVGRHRKVFRKKCIKKKKPAASNDTKPPEIGPLIS